MTTRDIPRANELAITTQPLHAQNDTLAPGSIVLGEDPDTPYIEFRVGKQPFFRIFLASSNRAGLNVFQGKRQPLASEGLLHRLELWFRLFYTTILSGVPSVLRIEQIVKDYEQSGSSQPQIHEPLYFPNDELAVPREKIAEAFDRLMEERSTGSSSVRGQAPYRMRDAKEKFSKWSTWGVPREELIPLFDAGVQDKGRAVSNLIQRVNRGLDNINEDVEIESVTVYRFRWKTAPKE